PGAAHAPFPACSHSHRGTGGHGGVSCGALEDTDFELSRGENGRERLNTTGQPYALASLSAAQRAYSSAVGRGTRRCGLRQGTAGHGQRYPIPPSTFHIHCGEGVI